MTSGSLLLKLLPWVLLAGVIAAWAGALYWDQFSPEVTTLPDQVWALSFLAFPIVGTVLASRIPHNAIGWLFLSGPLFAGLGVALVEYSESMTSPPARQLGEILSSVGFIALASSMLLFPDGRYPNRWFATAHLGMLAAIVIYPPLRGSELGLASLLLLTIAALVWRVIVGDGLTRRQIAIPLLVVVMGIVVMFGIGWLFPEMVDGWGSVVAFTLITIGVPVAIAVSVTKFRLYEIDRLISRTVTYAIVVGLLAGMVAVVATLVSTRFDDPLVVAATTLGVAAVFNPLRRMVQRVVDRRFNRSRYDAERVMDDFATTLRNEVDEAAVVDGWRGVVTETMHPSSVGVWVKQA